MQELTYAELFAGAGGLSMGLEAAGFHAVAHAEIEPHARAVLRHHWPDTRLDGDVTKVHGADYRGVTLLSGGSPCQDLSVAGKRAGLGGARSGLFYEQVRLWHESEAPYLLWENVGGALSSNHGRDFAAVLSALVGSPVSVPADGWRGGGGVVAGRAAVAAFRVLDLQHFGPPQRRVRVFVLAARAGGVDPAEVLALGEGVCGHPSPREQAREGVAGTLSSRTRGGGGLGTDFDLSGGVVAAFQEVGKRTGVSTTDPRAGIGIDPDAQAMYTLQAAAQHGVLTFAERGRADGRSVEVRADGTVNAIMTPNGGRSGTGAGDAVLAFHHLQDPISGAVSPSLGTTTDGMGVICTTGHVTHALTHEGADASEDGTGRGTPIVANCITAREAKGWNPAREVGNGTVQTGRPRRLTPKECERLMGWPDDHTRYGTREDGTTYELSDTARYRLCGNGVGSPCAAWIAGRLAAAVRP